MIQYLSAVTVTWIIFFIGYQLIFKKSTFFRYNRIYLLASFVLGLIIPMIAKYIQNADTLEAMRTVMIPELLIPSSSPIVESASTHFPWMLLIYAIGLVISASKLVYGLLKIYRHYNTGTIQKYKEFNIVHTEKNHLPFSFFQYVFISNKVPFTKNIQQILDHESAHMNQWHTIDILIIECVQILLWFHPMVYIYKKAIKQSHEFYADAYATRDSSKSAYSQLLAGNYSSDLELSLANQFFNSKIKDRLVMMQQSKNSKKFIPLYFLAIPVIGILLFSFASEKESIDQQLERVTVIASGNPDHSFVDKKLENPPLEESTDKPFAIVEEMPRFPGCDGEVTGEELETCAQQKLLKYVYTNIKYPKASRESGEQGMVVVQFIVNQEGMIEDPTLVRNVSELIDAEVLRMLDKMANEITWVPGKQSGKKVDVKFTLPVKFKLEGDEVEEEEEKTEIAESIEEVKETISFTVGPNPTSNSVNVFVEEVLSPGATITIFNKFGEEMVKADMTSREKSLNVQNLPSDTYVIVIKDGSKTSTKYFVKQ